MGAAYMPEYYCERTGAVPLAEGFTYNSGTNSQQLSVAELRALITTYVDPSHSVKP